MAADKPRYTKTTNKKPGGCYVCRDPLIVGDPVYWDNWKRVRIEPRCLPDDGSAPKAGHAPAPSDDEVQIQLRELKSRIFNLELLVTELARRAGYSVP